MSTKRNALNKDAKKEPACSHQPGQSAFKAILPEEIDWKPFAAFPASGRLAIAVGERIQKRPYTVRVKLPVARSSLVQMTPVPIKSDARFWMNSSRTSQEKPHHIPERNVTIKPIQTPKPGGMPRFICALIVCALIAAVVGVSSAMAATTEPKEAKLTELMSKDLTNLPGKEGLMLLIEYPPGSTDPIHRHNAHGFIYVLEGSIVMQVRGGKEVTLTPGQTFYEGPEDIHTVGRNASDTKPAKFVVFFVKDKGAPVLVPTK